MESQLLDAVVFTNKGQVACMVDDGFMILNLNDGVYYGLDDVGARIWELIQDRSAVVDIRDALLAEFDVDQERCEKDLLRLLGELIEARLVEVAPVEAE